MALPWDMADALSFGAFKIMIEHLSSSSQGNEGLDSGSTGLTAGMKISAAIFRLPEFPKSLWLFLPTSTELSHPWLGCGRIWAAQGMRNKTWEFIWQLQNTTKLKFISLWERFTPQSIYGPTVPNLRAFPRDNSGIFSALIPKEENSTGAKSTKPSWAFTFTPPWLCMHVAKGSLKPGNQPRKWKCPAQKSRIKNPAQKSWPEYPVLLKPGTGRGDNQIYLPKKVTEHINSNLSKAASSALQ